ncbi:hypothetical protein AQJ58_25720 [Streptomyces sp. DSM 15324]|nr:hypothetical protein AQJ58_25720 [Streptomyces sp. DSM 15324]
MFTSAAFVTRCWPSVSFRQAHGIGSSRVSTVFPHSVGIGESLRIFGALPKSPTPQSETVFPLHFFQARPGVAYIRVASSGPCARALLLAPNALDGLALGPMSKLRGCPSDEIL